MYIISDKSGAYMPLCWALCISVVPLKGGTEERRYPPELAGVKHLTQSLLMLAVVPSRGMGAPAVPGPTACWASLCGWQLPPSLALVRVAERTQPQERKSTC